MAGARLSSGCEVRLFLCGDVMMGRGLDQIMERPCGARLYEEYLKSAEDYVRLAEEANGPIPRPVAPDAIWGAAIEEWERRRPDFRIVNLETAITRSEDHVPKGINYRMSPENAACLAAGKLDCCTLANNHVLDWGRAGLIETLDTLDRLKIARAGAGRDSKEAAAPAALPVADGARILVFAAASQSSGTPGDWAAGGDAPGVQLIDEASESAALRFAERIRQLTRPGDIVVVSIHWGPNWGYAIPEAQRRFAHLMVERADAAVVVGHSSHHAKALEVHLDRLILYGCGDFINDYEGIGGFEGLRGDLAPMYFADVSRADGRLLGLTVVPLEIRNLSLSPASGGDIEWFRQTIERVSRRFGVRASLDREGGLIIRWS